jgi:WD40 repeat protein/serine/threonine protein kinase
MKTSPPNLDDLFHQAVEISDPAQRAAFLNAACGADASLRHEIEALLQHDQEGASFLESPPAGILDIETSPPSSSEFPGTTIGRYKLLEQIGEGGMGVVFVAEQIEPVRRRVALKIIKPGMDSKQVIARFEAERQALAMMDHPNIARIFDAGTIGAIKDERSGIRDDADDVPSLISHPSSLIAAPRPFFVMELVRGLPITDYCDKARLSPPQRLELFIDVCQAVQHAHQKGIIHRDLKPSNVMVTVHDGRPLVKVIDFGVAKAVGQQLTERTVYTAHTQLVGTPVYMSPEQADLSSQDVDTRSDVYSLGVLLYELLTGQTPFDKETLHKAGFDEMRRIIREEEPETVSNRIARTRRVGSAHHSADLSPSSLDLRPFAELDWIVMKALEKAPSRRYESASALAADIQRYLNDEPVLACPPTTMYRFQKFAKKHKPALATAAAVAACLLLGTTVSAWQAVRATTAEAQATSNEQKALANEQKAVANAAVAAQKEQEAITQRDEVKALADKLASKEQQLERTLYAAHMNLANHAWHVGAVGRVTDLLNQHRGKPSQRDLRAFEWRYLERLCHSELLTIADGLKNVWSVTYSPDGTRIAAATYGTVKVWDAETGREQLSLSGREEPWHRLARIAFTADGRRLASAGPDQTVKVWDADTGAELLSAKSPGELTGISFSPDGKSLAHASGEEVQVLDAATGQCLLTLKGHTTIVGGVAFRRDGKQLASVSRTHIGKSIEGQLKIWNAATGQELFNLPGPGASWDAPVVFSPNGSELASPGKDGAIKIWDPETGAELRTIPSGGENRVLGLAFSPDGRRLAVSTYDGFVRVWDAQRVEQLFMLKGISGPGLTSQDVAYSPHGDRLAVTAGGQLKIWDVRSPQEYRTIQEAKATTAFPPRLTAVFSSDGKRLIGAAGNDVKIWDVQTQHELLTLKGHGSPIHSVAISQDNKWIASGAGTWENDEPGEVKLWDATTGAEQRSFKTDLPGPVYCLAFRPKSNEFAAAYGRHRVRIWNAATGTELRTFAHIDKPGYIDGLEYSRDGNRLVTASYHVGTIKVWDANNDRELLVLKTKQRAGSALDVAISPDGKRLASGHGASAIRLWDAETGEELMLLKGHATHVNCVAFSHDGKRLASGSGDRAVKIWDTETGEELLSLNGHPVMLAGVAFSPDGTKLATTGQDETIRLWDATPLPEKPSP